MKRIVLIAALGVLASCNYLDKRESEGKKALGLHIEAVVSPTFQTKEMPQKFNEDAADDPALFLLEESNEFLVYGTDKKGGLALYTIEGKELKYYQIGAINNVDIRQNIILGQDTVSVIAGSDRDFDGLMVAALDDKGYLVESSLSQFKTNLVEEVYGFGMYYDLDAKRLFALINSKSGMLESWEITKNAEGAFEANFIESFDAGAQTEGVTADDVNKTVYLGVEEQGIWKFDMDQGLSSGRRMDNSGPSDNKNIVMDVEGIAVYKSTDSTGYLVASSQGNYSYAVFDIASEAYINSFRIVDGNGMDGVEETDGLEVSSIPTKGFPNGVLVVQDGYNVDENGEDIAQNFKVIDWKDVMEVLSLD